MSDPNRAAVARVKQRAAVTERARDESIHPIIKVDFDRATMREALKYIVDQAGPADMITIKRVANIALGRDNGESS